MKLSKNVLSKVQNKYIQHQNAVDYDWIGTNTFNRPAMAGYRALKLLLDKRPEF